MALTSSDWPLPCTPAIATTSPALISRDKLLTNTLPLASYIFKLLILRTVSPALLLSLFAVKSTVLPTIKLANSSWVAVGNVVPTTFPLRITVILSATSWTSRSL